MSYDPQPLLYWMRERHRIWMRRQAGKAWPWTKDPVLQAYRFCNVFRELDTVTIWIRENWRTPFANHKMLPFAMCMARQINLTGTLEEVGYPRRWDPVKFKERMVARKERGERLYTAAYMLTGGPKGSSKIDTTIRILNDVYERDYGTFFVHAVNSLEEAWESLTTSYGFGSFLAYEVVTDLRHTKWLNEAQDIMTWANPGPGARRGLNRLHGRELNERVSIGQCNEEMQKLLARARKALWKEDERFHLLEMRDIEHSLCETDKYLRVAEGRRPKQNYRPAGIVS